MLENKAAVISGGTSGIGYATARFFVRGARGAIVNINSCARQESEKVEGNGDAMFIKADVSRIRSEKDD